MPPPSAAEPVEQPSSAIQPSVPRAPPQAAPTPEQSGSPPPTPFPSISPTTRCNQDESLRALLLKVKVTPISGADALSLLGSPQNQALDWLIDKDSRYICDNDPNLQQRYSLAVFYFSTRGGRWLDCNAPSDLSSEQDVREANNRCSKEPQPNSGSDAWLTPGDECEWGGVICNDEGLVEVIDIGMKLVFAILQSPLTNDSFN